jgi:hypothetical protein
VRSQPAAHDAHRRVQSNIMASVGDDTNNTTRIAEMYGGVGTPSRVPIAYLLR